MNTEKTKNEKYAEKWFNENGFQCELIRQYISKTKYKVSKDGITEIFELPYGISEIRKYMEMYRQSFEMKKQIAKMKKQIAENQ